MTRNIFRLLAASLLTLGSGAFAAESGGGDSVTPQAVTPQLVISQVYGGGGNTGAPYNRDFVEIFNRGTSSASLSGYTIQYTSATGTGNFAVGATLPGAASLAPGQYYLIGMASGAVGSALPTVDVSGTSAMSATGGKVILANSTTALACNGGSTVCSGAQTALIIDLVGFGTANFFEGAGAAPAPSNTTAVFRAGAGCTDTNVNSADFTAAAPAPRNSATTLAPCSGPALPALSVGDVTTNEGDAGTSTLQFTVFLSSAAAADVTFTIATADGTGPNAATDADNDYEARLPGSLTIFAGNLSATYDVTINGDTTVEGNETFFVDISNPSANATIGDAQGIGTINNDDITTTLISTIQGSGAQSPYDGVAGIRARGIVTAVNGNTFWMQEEDADSDGNPLTSEGIFVFRNSGPFTAVALGDLVQVTGTIDDFGTLPATVTEFSQPAGPLTVTVVSSGNPLPTPVDLHVELPVNSTVYNALTYERFEGMRVSSTDLDVVAPNAPNPGQPNETTGTATTRGDFYVVLGGVARPMREEGIPASENPTVTYPGYAGPVFDENPELLRFNPVGQGAGTTALTLDAGDGIANFTGIMDQFQGNYSLLPDPAINGYAGPIVVPGAQIIAVRDTEYDEFTIAGANWFRFFDDVNDPAFGASFEPVANPAFYANRLVKASRVVCTMMGSPDIIGSVEVENIEVLQDIAAAVQANTTDCGATPPQYQAHLLAGNDVGSIDVGFLVRTDVTGPNSMPRVEVLDADPGSSELVLQIGKNTLFKNSAGAPVGGDLLNDRPSLVMMARIHAANGASEDVTVVANHLRSLSSVNSSGAGSSGYATAGARVRAKRHQQAVELAQWIEARQTTNPDERIVLVGDFNAFEFNDGYGHSMGTITGRPVASDNETVVPVVAGVPAASADLVSIDLTNTTLVKPLADRYSFVFDNNAQSLDHAVVNQNVLDDFALEVEHARINADFNLGHYDDYGPSDVTRMADHDPVVLFMKAGSFQIADLAAAVAVSGAPVSVGSKARFGVAVSNGGPAGSGATTLTLVLDVATAGMTISAPAGWSCSTPTVIGDTTTAECSTADVAVATTPSFNVDVLVADAMSNRTLVLTATVAGTTADPNPDNNDDAAGVQTTSSANLRLLFSGSNVPVRAGIVVPVYVRLDNYGPNTAVNPVVSITSNAPASAVGVTAPSGWTCTATGVVTAAIQCSTARFWRTSLLIPLKITVPSAFAGSSISFAGNVVSESSDPVPGNNSATYNLQVKGTPIAPISPPVD